MLEGDGGTRDDVWNFGLNLLNEAPYGAYAVDLSGVILYWNGSAERILGYAANEVVGLPCRRTLQGLRKKGNSVVRVEGCPAIQHLRTGRFPPVIDVVVRCVSGQWKPITITPLVVPRCQGDRRVLVNLFHEWHEHPLAGFTPGEVRDTHSPGALLDESPGPLSDSTFEHGIALTARELEILRLMGLDKRTEQIAVELDLSYHTVRNYIRNVREKLGANTKLSAVLIAQDRGLI